VVTSESSWNDGERRPEISGGSGMVINDDYRGFQGVSFLPRDAVIVVKQHMP
jgi:hypothetical protein